MEYKCILSAQRGALAAVGGEGRLAVETEKTQSQEPAEFLWIINKPIHAILTHFFPAY